MRKIKRFKISTRQKEIVRKLLRSDIDLKQAGLEDEVAVSRFVLSIAAQLDPGTVYELNQDALWELDHQNLLHKEMFSACVVTLGAEIEKYIALIADEQRLIAANTVIFEFLRTSVLFVADLVKEQADKEEYETGDLEFIHIPSLGVAAVPKIFREGIKAETELARKALPIILEKLNASKIDVAACEGNLTPKSTVVFLIPWLKKKRKGKAK